MQGPPRRRARACRLLLTAAISLAALLLLFLFLAATPTSLLAEAEPARALPVSPRRLPLTLRAVREATAARGHHPAPDLDAVLLPDWEVLVLLRRGAAAPLDANGTTCAFPCGASSPARALGRMPTSGRRAYTCALPRPARRRQPFRAPRLITATSSSSSFPADAAGEVPARSPETMMLRWSGRLVYDSATLGGGDVLVFAKGVNPRQGVSRDAADVRCVYYRRGAVDGGGIVSVVASLPAATSAQQVFRCPPPPTMSSPELRVTLAVAGEEPIPSMATYSPPRGARGGSSLSPEKEEKKKLICACTMVRDVAKFLREWVVYHAAVGVDRFYVYDNGSEDDLAGQVSQLSAAGFDISTRVWPWPKTQEAGFSYAAAVHQGSCEWMAFIDVDEFIFSPGWARSRRPTKTMLRSLVQGVKPDVGQVSLGCADFGPSGQTTHPKEGVTQGYTCRRRAEERHKSLLRLDAVDRSLLNSVHHFELQPGFKVARSRRARVNHYKYQAWDEFKVKFRRRVSTYVSDWTDPMNPGSKDRAPGLGFEAVEPAGWAHKFCEVEDTLLQEVTRKWFGVGFRNELAGRRDGPTHSTPESGARPYRSIQLDRERLRR